MLQLYTTHTRQMSSTRIDITREHAEVIKMIRLSGDKGNGIGAATEIAAALAIEKTLPVKWKVRLSVVPVIAHKFNTEGEEIDLLVTDENEKMQIIYEVKASKSRAVMLNVIKQLSKRAKLHPGITYKSLLLDESGEFFHENTWYFS